jgi:hypothetical protein
VDPYLDCKLHDLGGDNCWMDIRKAIMKDITIITKSTLLLKHLEMLKSNFFYASVFSDIIYKSALGIRSLIGLS